MFAELVDVLKPLDAIILIWPASSGAMAKLDGMAMFLKRLSIRYTLMLALLAREFRPELHRTTLTNAAHLIDAQKICSILKRRISWREFAYAHCWMRLGSNC
jgi:hypothetical protein